MKRVVGVSVSAAWKRLRNQYVVTALGIALAVGASVAIGGWQTDPVETNEAGGTPQQFAVTETPGPTMTYYLVDSRERADWVNYVTGALEPSAAAPVLLTGTPEEQQASLTLFKMTLPPDTFFIDLRRP